MTVSSSTTETCAAPLPQPTLHALPPPLLSCVLADDQQYFCDVRGGVLSFKNSSTPSSSSVDCSSCAIATASCAALPTGQCTALCFSLPVDLTAGLSFSLACSFSFSLIASITNDASLGGRLPPDFPGSHSTHMCFEEPVDSKFETNYRRQLGCRINT